MSQLEGHLNLFSLKRLKSTVGHIKENIGDKEEMQNCIKTVFSFLLFRVLVSERYWVVWHLRRTDSESPVKAPN